MDLSSLDLFEDRWKSTDPINDKKWNTICYFQSKSNIDETERERQKWLHLSGERTGGSKLLADEISGGDVRNTEKGRKSASVRAFSDAGAP